MSYECPQLSRFQNHKNRANTGMKKQTNHSVMRFPCSILLTRLLTIEISDFTRDLFIFCRKYMLLSRSSVNTSALLSINCLKIYAVYIVVLRERF